MTVNEAIQELESRKAFLMQSCVECWDPAMEMALQALKAQRWIPCSERLPDDDRTKVVTLANGNVEAGYYSNGDWWCVGDSITLENPTVIAWMPLPKQYKPHEVE